MVGFLVGRELVDDEFTKRTKGRRFLSAWPGKLSYLSIFWYGDLILESCMLR